MAYNYSGGYGQSNPYDTPSSNASPAYGQAYNSGAYNNRHEMEMQPMANNDSQYTSSGPPAPSHAILNECATVGVAITDLQSRLQSLERKQRDYIDGRGSNKEIDSLSADIMTGYRGLTDRVRRIKSKPEAGSALNRPQVDALDRKIRKAINEYQQTESHFRKAVEQQQYRQFQLVRPGASEAEFREAIQDGADTQIFQQALLNSDRRGQSQTVLGEVRQRQNAIQQIERTLIELQQLFQDLDTLLVQQEPMIQNIEQKAEETNTHLEAGNIHVGKAVDSARAARKKKWICLGIVVLIILIIIVVVLAYGATQGWFSHKQAQ